MDDDKTVAGAISALAFQVQMLGGGLNSDHRGALEFLGSMTVEGATQIADALRTAGGEISGPLGDIASALERIATAMENK